MPTNPLAAMIARATAPEPAPARSTNPLAALVAVKPAVQLSKPAVQLADVIERGKRTSTAGPAEGYRIVDLPQRDYSGADFSHLEKTGQINLRPIQHEALAAIKDADGGLLPIGVGHGKSLIVTLAGTVLGCDLAIVFTPASTVTQLRQTVMQARVHLRLTCAVRVQSYAMLSRPGGTAMIDKLAEGVDPTKLALVFDEAHKLANPRAARTKRVQRFIAAHPDARVVATSGTLLSKSLGDLAHLSEWALRDLSPIPRDRDEALAWARCLDPDGQASGSDWREFGPVWAAAYPGQPGPEATFPVERRQAMAREAWQARMRSCPGVVASRAGSLGASLLVQLHLGGIAVPQIVRDALDKIDDGEDMAGDPIPDDVTAWRLARNASMGFYYIWDWPGEPDTEWLDARKEWHRCVRRELEHASTQGYDSPFLIASRLQRELDSQPRGQLRWIHFAWEAWAAVKHRPAPPTLAVWLDDYLIRWICDFVAHAKQPWIVFYDTVAVADALEAAGLKVYRAGDAIPASPAHHCAASIQAHGTGLNLQAWSHMLIAAMPSSGKTAEQLIGRLHRQGQTADTVVVKVLAHLPPLLGAWEKACENAAFIEQTTGNAQKLCFADVER